MRKSEMNSLVAGVKVQSKKDSTVYEIAGLDKEQQKAILTDGKVYSFSTLYRWFNLYVEPVAEEKEDTEEQDTTADTDTTAQDTEEQTNTNDLKDTDTQDDQLYEDADTAVKKDIVEANTATTNSTGKTNTVQPTIQQDNLIQSLNNLVDLHGCYLQAKKEYIAVKKDGYKGTVCMIRNCRYGNGIHIDMKSKIWIALDEEYRQVVSKDHYTGIYDKTRKLFRIGYVRDLDILQVVILTALQIAS